MTQYELDRIPARGELMELYSSVGWSTYTTEPDRLELAVRQSLRVATAWEDGFLVGLARVVGDGVTIVYLQDVLVHPHHARSGVGTRLVTAIFEPYSNVRQHVLMTDDEPEQRAFYESLGFTEVHDTTPRQLRSFARFLK
ncbi:MAG: GNAT family N-acetyltransferase [Microbacteriaceae bacterium]